jgi:hypothetical protein
MHELVGKMLNAAWALKIATERLLNTDRSDARPEPSAGAEPA